MAVQGPVIAWVADHRKHHAHTDEEGDPHSPHVGHDGGVRGVFAGLWHAHAGWLMSTQGRADWKQVRARPLRGRRDAVHQPPLRPAGLARPGAARPRRAIWSPARSPAPPPGCSGADWYASSSSTTSPGASTPCATSSARRRFDTDDRSTNVFWLALPSLGESWHHNHHAFPRSASMACKRWELDPSAADHRRDGEIGLARNVVRISPERQAERVALDDHPNPHWPSPNWPDCQSRIGHLR